MRGEPSERPEEERPIQRRIIEPSLRREEALWRDGVRRIAGVDEAGVGSLVGPVIAAAVILPVGAKPIEGVRDSKLLSRKARERLYDEIRKSALDCCVGVASVREIERINILHATHLAMRRALGRVEPYDYAIIDGRAIRDVELGPHTTLVNGDLLCYSISCASIIAKVARDRFLVRLANRYPGYGWEHNAGYGTAFHLAALRELGLTPYHRRTYAPVRAIFESQSAPNRLEGAVSQA